MKMRLIDADKLKYKEYKIISIDKDGKEHHNKMVCVLGKKIMTQPSVNAIPVSFIKQLIVDATKENQNVQALHILLAIWEQERQKED